MKKMKFGDKTIKFVCFDGNLDYMRYFCGFVTKETLDKFETLLEAKYLCSLFKSLLVQLITLLCFPIFRCSIIVSPSRVVRIIRFMTSSDSIIVCFTFVATCILY